MPSDAVLTDRIFLWLKVLVVILIVRLFFHWLGFTDHIPLLDDLLWLITDLFGALIRFGEKIFPSF